MNIKHTKFTCLLITVILVYGCGNTKENPSNEVIGNSPQQQTVSNESSHDRNDNQEPTQSINDKYVGNWNDISNDPNDKSEIFTITKLHDTEYQIGDLKGTLKQLVNGAEYISLWSQDVEIQFIYDNHTDHLIMRTPFMSKELRKIR